MGSAPSVTPSAVGWAVQPLRDLTSVLRRGTAPVYVDASDVHAIGQRCVTDTDFNPDFARPHSSHAMANVLSPLWDDVLINSTGTGTIGRSVIFREQSGRYIVDGHVTVAHPWSGHLVGRWLNEVLRSPAGQQYLESRCYSGSTNQIELSVSALSRMPIPVPTFREQWQIAEILDTLDDQIRLIESRIAKLGLMRTGLLDTLLTYDGKRDLRRLDSIADVERGKFGHRPRNDPKYLGGPFPFIQTGDVAASRGGYIWDATQSLSSRGASVSREFPRGTIAVTIAANIADTAILSRPMYFPDSVVGVSVHAPNSVRYIELVIRRAKPQLEARAPQSAQRNINLQDLRPLLIPLPEASKQIRIAEIYEAHEAAIGIEQALLIKLRGLKQGLVSDLLTGRVRVPMEAMV